MALQLITRHACEPCDRARAALEALGLAYDEVDVDSDAGLQQRFGERVPVLLEGSRAVLEGRIDRGGLLAVLGTLGTSGDGGVVVVAAGPASAREVHRLTQAAFGGYGWLTPPSSALSETEDDVRRDLAAHGGALAWLDGVAVGALRLVAEPGQLLVRRVAVDPARQGRGIGRELMAWAHGHAAGLGARSVRVGVRAQLPANRRFYESLGYTATRSYARPGSDEVVWYEMERPVA